MSKPRYTINKRRVRFYQEIEAFRAREFIFSQFTLKSPTLTRGYLYWLWYDHDPVAASMGALKIALETLCDQGKLTNINGFKYELRLSPKE